MTPQSVNSTDFSAFNQNSNRIALGGFGYDTSGNLTGDSTTGANSMVYDSENRQTSYAKAGATTSYSYDGDGRRVKKVVGNVTTVFVYNVLGQLIAEYTSDPVPPAQGGGGTSYLTSDHLGSTRAVTKADGTVKARYDYLPFGEEIASDRGSRSLVIGYGASDGTRQKFTQKERDNESAGQRTLITGIASGMLGSSVHMLLRGLGSRSTVPTAEVVNTKYGIKAGGRLT